VTQGRAGPFVLRSLASVAMSRVSGPGIWPVKLPRCESVPLIVLRLCYAPAVAFFASMPAFGYNRARGYSAESRLGFACRPRARMPG
jgi:hypothetical protein